MNVNVTKLKPVNGKILVQRAKAEEKSSSGLVIPEAIRKAELGMGTVISGSKDYPKNKIVVFNKFSGQDIGDDYLILAEADVIATYEG